MGTHELLLATAFSVGFVHTLTGMDHTLPFILLGRAQNWSLARLLVVTGVCSLGHLGSSLLLAGAAILGSLALEQLELIERLRGEWAAWLLISFGLCYTLFSLFLRRRRENKPLLSLSRLPQVTVWSLFIIFVLGPCEPLIPLVLVPAMQQEWSTLLAVVLVFGTVTLATMLTLVGMGYLGMRLFLLRPLERHMHTLSGLAIVLSGLAMRFLGL